MASLKPQYSFFVDLEENRGSQSSTCHVNNGLLLPSFLGKNCSNMCVSVRGQTGQQQHTMFSLTLDVATKSFTLNVATKFFKLNGATKYFPLNVATKFFTLNGAMKSLYKI